MKRPAFFSLLAACSLLVAGGLLAVACNDGINHPPPPVSNSEVHEYSDIERKFLDDALELQMRDEQDVEKITIQYVLIANGIINATGSKPELSLPESLTKAAEVYQEALKGADFDKLVLTHSYGRLERGQRPGTWTLYRTKLLPNLGPATFLRTQEETAVWKAGWRLSPGEIGPVERHEKDANSGYYIVRRLTDEEIKKDNPANFPAANEQVQAMRDDAKALMERPEHHASRVKVQHILIARYMSDANGKMKMLQPAEAEELAAKVYELAKQADGKEAFDDLVRKYTYDDSKGDTPGEYLIVADEEDALPPQRARKGFVRSFGDVAWRLKVGEVGIAMYDSAKSNYGYHIIKRIE